MAELSCLPIAQCSEGNDLAEVEENDSNDTPVCDDDAHKVVLYARGLALCAK